MLKAVLAVTGLVLVTSVAAGIGSKLASSKPQVEFVPGPAISPMDMMLKFDMTQPAVEIKDLI
jgi:hypothetical protein